MTTDLLALGLLEDDRECMPGLLHLGDLVCVG